MALCKSDDTRDVSMVKDRAAGVLATALVEGG